MKKISIIFLLLISINIKAQFRYGITAGLNISSAILPELKLNTDIESILKGDDIVQGNPQLADFVALYKAGIFFRYDAKIGSIKLNINYTTTNINKTLDLDIFSINAINVQLSYIDFDLSYQLNLFKHLHLNFGYVPSILLSKNISWADIKKIDTRVLSGIGIKFYHGVTIDINAVVGIKEIIKGSYIHNVMIPVTLNIPLNNG